MNTQILVGKTREHLCQINQYHWLHYKAIEPFLALQQSAKKAGFNLQIASSFRDFERQKLIWNEKFLGLRKVHNAQGEALDLSSLNDWEKAQAILNWSALPALSRHHWGTDLDIYDPSLLPANQKLQLEPWEYQAGGYFFELSQWLLTKASEFEFNFPFLNLSDPLRIEQEPWHLSFQSVAQEFAQQLTKEVIVKAWQGEDLQGFPTLIEHLDEILAWYVVR